MVSHFLILRPPTSKSHSQPILQIHDPLEDKISRPQLLAAQSSTESLAPSEKGSRCIKQWPRPQCGFSYSYVTSIFLSATHPSATLALWETVTGPPFIRGLRRRRMPRFSLPTPEVSSLTDVPPDRCFTSFQLMGFHRSL